MTIDINKRAILYFTINNYNIILADSNHTCSRQRIICKVDVACKSWDVSFIDDKNIFDYNFLQTFLNQLEQPKLVIFHPFKPYSRFLIHLAKERNWEIEIWEEGLHHYIRDLKRNFYEILKDLVKSLFGEPYYYPFVTDARNYKVSIFDRFGFGGLKFPLVSIAPDIEMKVVYFIGQPMVEDGICSYEAYSKVIRFLSSFKNLNVIYVYHPREKNKYLPGIVSERLDQGFEDYVRLYNPKAYGVLSYFSSVNMNINVINNIHLYPLLGLDLRMPVMKNVKRVDNLDILMNELKIYS